MKKNKFAFIYKDETEQYEVKIFPFILKLLVSVLALLFLIQLALLLPEEVKDKVKYSGDEYYISRCEAEYTDREFDKLYDLLTLYDLRGENYEIYWEIVNGYADYIQYMNYSTIEDRENVIVSYTLKSGEQQEVSFVPAKKIEEYRNKVLENAENVKYERNKRYLTEFAQKVQ